MFKIWVEFKIQKKKKSKELGIGTICESYSFGYIQADEDYFEQDAKKPNDRKKGQNASERHRRTRATIKGVSVWKALTLYCGLARKSHFDVSAI